MKELLRASALSRNYVDSYSNLTKSVSKKIDLQDDFKLMQIPPHDQRVDKKMRQNLQDSKVYDETNDNRKVIYSSACKDSPNTKL